MDKEIPQTMGGINAESVIADAKAQGATSYGPVRRYIDSESGGNFYGINWAVGRRRFRTTWRVPEEQPVYMPLRSASSVTAGSVDSGTATDSQEAVSTSVKNQAPEDSAVVPNDGIQGMNAPAMNTRNMSARRRRRNAALKTLQTHVRTSNQPAPKIPVVSRKRSLEQSASAESPSDSKRARLSPKTESPFGEKVAVIPVNFPAESVLIEHVGAIQEAVITRLLDAPDPLPRLTFGTIIGGALHIHCANQETVLFLSTVIGERKIAGLSFKVVLAKDLPRPVKMAWKTKIVGVQDIRVLLKLLQRYNPRLHTEQWKLIDVSMSEASSRRIILVDRASADVIQDAGFLLNSGIDISSFKVLEDTGAGLRNADEKNAQ